MAACQRKLTVAREEAAIRAVCHLACWLGHANSSSSRSGNSSSGSYKQVQCASTLVARSSELATLVAVFKSVCVCVLMRLLESGYCHSSSVMSLLCPWRLEAEHSQQMNFHLSDQQTIPNGVSTGAH